MRFPWILLALLIGISPTSPALAKPQRIVSISLCADILLLYLAERQHIASVTFLATSRVRSSSTSVRSKSLAL